MHRTIDLSRNKWTLCGFWPQAWEWGYSMETGAKILPEVGPVPAKVPGSVQAALLAAGVLPDWNQGLNARHCEWVENRSWIFNTILPLNDLPTDSQATLRFDGLDGNGIVLVNGQRIGNFDNAFMPYSFPVNLCGATELKLEVIFEQPPRWLGQICRTSQIKDFKPRFNYSWDWTSRLVQIGIWDNVYLEITSGSAFADTRCTTALDLRTGQGSVSVYGSIHAPAQGQRIRLSLAEKKSGVKIVEQTFDAADISCGLRISELPVQTWWPNGIGAQPLYMLRLELMRADETVLDVLTRNLGFRNIEWHACQDAPARADPWLCVINGESTFLQGVNWTPLKPNFADVTDSECRLMIERYRDLGCNILRVWGGAVLERESFYDACDEFGLLVWQEFPLSSSGIENWPPEDNSVINQIETIAESYITRRQHHPSLLLWCGGNELQGGLDGSKVGCGKPVDEQHPLIHRLQSTVQRLDPQRRFLPTSSSGPRFCADKADYGKGLHWDVHGPWGMVDEDRASHNAYWQADDALFRSEAGCPGASSAELILRYAGEGISPLPVSLDNPIWRRTSWWFDWPQFIKEHGHEPASLEEYTAWSQQRQAQGLAVAAESCKQRFPRCGGFIVWMGHDSFPCTCNTAIIDFEGDLKPAALALREIFRTPIDKSQL